MNNKIISTIVCILVCLACYAENGKLPSKLTKGVIITTDEFTGKTTYAAKNSYSIIEQNGDSISLEMKFVCYAYDTPISLNKIYVLTNGRTSVFDNQGRFTSKTISERYMSRNATGTFGTSSFRGAEFSSRQKYVESFVLSGAEAIEITRSIISYGGKIRFEGKNNTIDVQVSNKSIKDMSKIIAIYEYFKK